MRLAIGSLVSGQSRSAGGSSGEAVGKKMRCMRLNRHSVGQDADYTSASTPKAYQRDTLEALDPAVPLQRVAEALPR